VPAPDTDPGFAGVTGFRTFYEFINDNLRSYIVGGRNQSGILEWWESSFSHYSIIPSFQGSIYKATGFRPRNRLFMEF
jgi:hypothetical protein